MLQFLLKHLLEGWNQYFQNSLIIIKMVLSKDRRRSTFDAIRTIDDLLELAKITNGSSILMAVDFEKAFDYLDHKYLFKVLEKFNFGPYSLQ